MIEAAADLGSEVPVAHHLRPVEQQIIVIENVLPLLRFDIGGEEFLQRIGPFAAPGKGGPQHLLDRQFGIDAARIDGEAGALRRKAAIGSSKARAGGARGSSDRPNPRGHGS